VLALMTGSGQSPAYADAPQAWQEEAGKWKPHKEEGSGMPQSWWPLLSPRGKTLLTPAVAVPTATAAVMLHAWITGCGGRAGGRDDLGRNQGTVVSGQGPRERSGHLAPTGVVATSRLLSAERVVDQVQA